MIRKMRLTWRNEQLPSPRVDGEDELDVLLEQLDDHQDDDDHLEHLVHRVRWGQATVQTHLHTLVSSCFLITLIKCLKGHKPPSAVS